MFCRTGFLVVGLPLLACGADTAGLTAPDGSEGNKPGAGQGSNIYDGFAPALEADTSAVAAATVFPGGGTSGAAAPLVAALAPETSSQCDPEPSPSPGATSSAVQTVCFFGPDSDAEPAAVIEQVVEVVGTEEWVHLRLTLNPAFVDNTYGGTAIGWDGDDESAPEAPPPAPGDAPPVPGETPPPPAGALPPPPDAPAPPVDAPPPPADAGAPLPEARPDRAGPGAQSRPGPRPGRGGHTFRDLVGSDHAEIQLLDADGEVAVHFKLDYISESSSAASGYASLGVAGGEGAVLVGEPDWFLATATSLDRNLNACGLDSFTDSSPETDAAYIINRDAPDWDYRVAYEAWVSSDAFGEAGFGSALIENVHASPSKLAGNTVDVSPAPCPVDPSTPEATPVPVPAVLQKIR
jgi:hypothetical protein